MKRTQIIKPDAILSAAQRHPRVTHQGLVADDTALQRLKEGLKPLIPFGEATYHGLLVFLDWDHRIPSQVSILRIYTYYSVHALRIGAAQLSARNEEIQDRDRFPEFDVPDFAGLTADEVYEADVEADGRLAKIHLTSPWRREIEPATARTSVTVARESQEFKNLLAQISDSRADHLGELEAIAWTPPCETELTRWTVDVWYLTHLDSSVGRGHSLLVDLEERSVVGIREFVVRAG